MCGIFGIVNPDGVDLNTFQWLAALNQERGERGEGWLQRVNGHTAPIVTKFDRESMDPPEIANFPSSKLVLGHCLAPTNGDEVNVNRIHPFETKDFWFAHNGILLDYKRWAQWRGVLPDVDSCYMLGGIQTMVSEGKPIETAIAYVADAMKGQFACWLYHKATGDTYLWRNMSPLYISTDTAQFMFSSVKCEAVDVLIPEGLVFKIPMYRPRMNRVGCFKADSIYEVIN